MKILFHRWRAVVLFAAIALVGVSCDRSSMIPPEAAARVALETSLAAWRDGKKPGDTVKADPPVQSVDSEWNSGRKLVSFEILHEEPSEGDRRFLVRLHYREKPTEAEVVYVVLNVRPYSVFRKEDFDRSMNMENNPVGKRKR